MSLIGLQVLSADNAPVKFYNLRTDNAVVPLPARIPNVGNCTGMGRTIIDPNFKTHITRITDCSMAPAQQAFSIGDDGNNNLFSTDDSHLIVTAVTGESYVISLDPTATRLNPQPTSFAASKIMFSRVRPNVIYQLDGTQIIKYTFDSETDPNWAAPDKSVLFDFASDKCMGEGYQATWSAGLTIAYHDEVFGSAFSDSGGQGTGYHIVVYTPKKGCRVLDTRTMEITGQWGPTGRAVDKDGKDMTAKFTIHMGGVLLNPAYSSFAVMIGSGKDLDGETTGCVAGDCVDFSPYIWSHDGLSLNVCTLDACQGHSAKGYQGFATGVGLSYFKYDNFNVPPVELNPYGPRSSVTDIHGSWNNGGIEDKSPAFIVTSVAPAKIATPYPFPFYQEVDAADGNYMYRACHNFNSTKSPFFQVAHAIGVVSTSGNLVAFASDWQNTLGVDLENRPRGDVFVVKLNY